MGASLFCGETDMLTCARCDHGLKDIVHIFIVGSTEYRYALCLGKYESTLFFSEIKDFAFLEDTRWEYPRWLRQS
jgi:hypothetical protein